MRGFGVTIGDFALESQMDEIARTIGMNPFELRLLNAYRDGDMRAYRKRVEDAALVEVIQKAAQLAGESLAPRFAAMRSTTREGLIDG
jgi:CO/xanthine dehydrogenase Mo-binding subunit